MSLASVARYWWLILILAVGLAVVGVLAAERRQPTWSATSELNVGRLDIQAQAIPGYVQGAQSLATTYSRIVSTPTITSAVERQLGERPGSLATHISAAPLPASQIFRIVGTGPSREAALRVSRAATRQTQAYVAGLGRGPESASSILRQYRSASAQADRLQAQRDSLRSRRAADASSVSSARVNEASVEASSAQLRASALGTRYQNQVQNAGGAAQVQVLRTADVATSDASATRQKYGFLGFAVGALLGVTLAVLLARRRRT